MPRTSSRAARCSCGRHTRLASPRGHVREIDLAGDTLRETNVNAVNAELAAMGQHSITRLQPRVQRLPNGDIGCHRQYSEDHQRQRTPTTYTGNMVLVLDQNFQVTWVWNAFKWLDTNRLATLARARATGCTPTPSAGRPKTGT